MEIGGRFVRCTVVLQIYWCQMAHAVEMYNAPPLFSGDIKELPAAIGKSTKRGQKKGLFAM